MASEVNSASAAANISATLGISNNTNSTTASPPVSNGELFLAYGSLFAMALFPIYIGSIRSIKNLANKKAAGEVETISGKDAAMFPFIASAALFGIFLFFKMFSKEYINMLLAFYFFAIGIFAIAHMINPYLRPLIPSSFRNSQFRLVISEQPIATDNEASTNANSSEPAVAADADSAATDPNIFDFCCERKDFIGFAVALAIGLWYLSKKHWIANNVFGLAFSINAVELLQLNTIFTGCILLGGLFVYDIFWVFATDVMVTVAKSFEAPIKLIFPRDFFVSGFASKNFAMLGLGDIVVPGIFIALLLRFDHGLRPGSRTYFHAGFFAYIVGLGTTIFIMHVFKHAQPALLYLVPSCLGIPLAYALIRGDLSSMLKYEDNPVVPSAEANAVASSDAEPAKDKDT